MYLGGGVKRIVNKVVPIERRKKAWNHTHTYDASNGIS